MPITKRKNESKNADNYTKNHKTSKEQSRPENENNSNYESNNSLTWWGMIIWIIIFTFSKFNTIVWWNNNQDFERKIEKLEWEVDTLKNNQWTTVWVHYGWWADSLNNVFWIWERSLWYPDSAKWKTCYVIWDKLRGVEWWAIWWYLWIAWNGWRYKYSTQYEANLNNLEQKIEIIKNVWSDKNLTKTERNNLYLSLTLLCH